MSLHGAAPSPAPSTGRPTAPVGTESPGQQLRDVSLSFLLAELLAARAALALELSRPRNGPPVDARMTLLACLEAYAAALTERRLPIPPRMRDDLRLQRAFFPPSRDEKRGR